VIFKLLNFHNSLFKVKFFCFYNSILFIGGKRTEKMSEGGETPKIETTDVVPQTESIEIKEEPIAPKEEPVPVPQKTEPAPVTQTPTEQQSAPAPAPAPAPVSGKKVKKSVVPRLKTSCVPIVNLRNAATDELQNILSSVKKKSSSSTFTLVLDPSIVGPLTLIVPFSALKVF
jgi:hypothetical protein